MNDGAYDLVVVGTGFASTFFLHRYLERAPPSVRVLVLERGEAVSHKRWTKGWKTPSEAPIDNRTPPRRWLVCPSSDIDAMIMK